MVTLPHLYYLSAHTHTTITNEQEKTNKNNAIENDPLMIKRFFYSLTLTYDSRLAMATFLASLDGTIIATALPKIASDFEAQSQMSWVATAYLLTYSKSPSLPLLIPALFVVC